MTTARKRPAKLLQFTERLEDTGGSRWPTEGLIEAFRDGERAGYVGYLLSRREAKALIRMIEVRPEFRRLGIATEIMNELHRRHPRIATLLLPELLPDGRVFFAAYRHRGKTDRNRTS